MSLRATRAAAVALAICALWACASRPAAPAPGLAAVEGTVRLVPRDGAPSHSGGGGSYGDRRMHDVRLVDYSKPEASVVFLDAGSRPGGRVELAAESAISGARLTPKLSVVGAGGEIAITNRTSADIVVSLPAAERVEQIAPGAQWAWSADRAGALEIFLLGAEEPVRVWVSPGPWTRPDAGGHFALTDLPPGSFTLRAWHPRLPSASAPVDLQADATATVNFEIGVGRGEGAHEAH